MLVRLLLITILIAISLFCWISLINPMSVEFRFFGRVIPTDLSTLMISSFVLGAILVFISTLARDAKRALEDFQQSRQAKKKQSLKEDFNKGMDYFLRGDLSKAKSLFVEVLKRNPSQIDLYFRLSEISLREDRDEEALYWLEKARLIDMRNVDILLGKASLYKQMNRSDEAIRTLNLAISFDETNLKALKSLRESYLESKRWDEAIKVQKSILKLAKEKQAEEETFFYYGLKYEHARDLLNRGGEENLENALKETKDIIREQKTFQPGFVLLGDIYLQLGKPASAGKVWGKSFTRFESIIFMLRLEELYLGQGDPSTLFRIYQRALRHNPDKWVLNFFYAKFCLRLEMLDEALEVINEISLKIKDLPALHRLLAEIYLHKKDFGLAAQEFEKTFKLSGSSYFPFSCSVCGRESIEWIAYCSQCHQWSTYIIKEDEKTISPLSIPFSERAPFSLSALE